MISSSATILMLMTATWLLIMLSDAAPLAFRRDTAHEFQELDRLLPVLRHNRAAENVNMKEAVTALGRSEGSATRVKRAANADSILTAVMRKLTGSADRKLLRRKRICCNVGWGFSGSDGKSVLKVTPKP